MSKRGRKVALKQKLKLVSKAANRIWKTIPITIEPKTSTFSQHARKTIREVYLSNQAFANWKMLQVESFNRNDGMIDSIQESMVNKKR